MANKFIEQVESIVMSNLADEKFGASELASAIGLSTSQTLRKVKAETGKSATQYIRELRLQEAAKLIEKTDLTYSEISYKTGFGSPSYFNRMFLKHYGITPSDFKARKHTDQELAAQKKSRSRFSKKRLYYIISIVIGFVICYLVVGYLFINRSISDNAIAENSIAVLPFKDLSPDDTQWFCDGVSDNILHSLAQVNGLTVTSFTSSATYRNSEKKIPEIAKELGVSYVLEGSVLLFEDKIKVIAQLIDSNDNHVWSKEYNDTFDNVIAVQNNVAQEVMTQLQITLNLDEQIAFEKPPTKNMEAYHLYLEGKLINNSTKRDDLIKNIENNKKAIALDSNFVDAYTEVAASNMIRAITGLGRRQNLKEAMSYVDKALAIDPNSAKANAIKARLLLGNDWDQSKEYFEKAIALNPNDANSHNWYGFYFLNSEKTDLKRALHHSSIAIKLSPFSRQFAQRYAWALILNEKYEEAETYIKEYDFLIGWYFDATFNLWIMLQKTKSWESGFNMLLDNTKREPENGFWHYPLSFMYGAIAYDKDKALYHANKMIELIPGNSHVYMLSLSNNNLFKEIEEYMQSEAFENLSENSKMHRTWEYYYYKEDYIQAHNIMKEHPENFNLNVYASIYAQLGDRKRLDSINRLNNLHFIKKNQIKAELHAVLKERDSMYYYLNKTKYSMFYPGYILIANKAFAPYKDEARFKAILKEYHIPYTPSTNATNPKED